MILPGNRYEYVRKVKIPGIFQPAFFNESRTSAENR